jgi:hypothetical protein
MEVFGLKKDEVTWECRRLHNEELYDLYCSDDQVKNDILDPACGTCGNEQRCIQVSVGKPEWKRPPGKSNRKWDDNIKMDLWRAWNGLICLIIVTDGWLL